MQIPSNWTFEDNDVAKNFNKHVREQLPFYDLATNAISHIARHYVPEDGLVYDVGASTGNIGKSITKLLKEKARIVCLREIQRSIKDSVKELIVSQIKQLNLDNFLPVITLEAIFAKGIPLAFETNGTVLLALGFTSII